jgi:twitching motility protein PilT
MLETNSPLIDTLLGELVSRHGSDLHLSAGLPPMLRVHGDLVRMDRPASTHDDLLGMAKYLMTAEQHRTWEQTFELDFAYEIQGLGRFRVNAFFHHRGAGMVFRQIAGRIPTLKELDAPAILADLALKPRGLMLVTGPTGSGKSTTLAAMLDWLNQNSSGHIITVEDPIEFVHTSGRCLVHQREVGAHTSNFNAALRSALREDPDAILVGELRDLETIRLALTAAETGHLVLATLHTSSAPKTIDRLIDVFPAQEKEMVRSLLSESLLAVVSQTLCKTVDGAGRVAAFEIMLGTPAIRNLIREGKIAQMYSSIQTGSSLGMQTLDQSLALLVKKNLITAQTAKGLARLSESIPT